MSQDGGARVDLARGEVEDGERKGKGGERVMLSGIEGDAGEGEVDCGMRLCGGGGGARKKMSSIIGRVLSPYPPP